MNKKENRPETSLSTILVIEDRLMNQGEKFISDSYVVEKYPCILGIFKAKSFNLCISFSHDEKKWFPCYTTTLTQENFCFMLRRVGKYARFEITNNSNNKAVLDFIAYAEHVYFE